MVEGQRDGRGSRGVTIGEDPVLQVRDLKTYFFTKRGAGQAVDGVSFDLGRGETLGLVGESGCGKSITALSIMGLHPKPAARIVGGQVLFHGEDLLKKSPGELRRYRGKRIALILQDPITALDPVFTIANQVGEPLRFHQRLRGRSLRERAVALLKLLRIPAPEQRLNSYPHQFSGGMRQRVVGAIALSCGPEVLIADEPTTSLDVTVQAAYLALLKEIQRQTELAILFITHDFGVVAKMCDRVAVMYAGKVVETAPTWELFDAPAHPYTEALLNSVPDVRLGTTRLASIEGHPPSVYALPKGCPFAARCRYVMPRCQGEFPPEVEVAKGHRVSCWRHG
ncbi:MAG: ABC transporter ATP-binding protein [Nitrospinae bacterium]|nr:ABC transporter ATP-binding protein [Nitrospinota bacterium]